MPSITLSRDDLFDLAWSQPMRTLAVRFGISDVALAKRCRRLRIPIPGRGHWAKQAAGKRVKIPALPAPRTPAEHAPVRLVEPSPTTEAPIPAFTVDEAPIDAQEDFEDRPENRIVVRSRLSKHPAIHASAAYLAEQRGAPLSRIRTYGDGTVDIVVALQSVRRALLWMDAFVRACEARGFEIIGACGYERTSHVRVLGQKVQFRLFEPEHRIDILKESGKRVPPKSIFFTRYRYEGAGVLEFRMGHQYGSERGTWRDHKDAPLEDQLNDIMVGLVEAAAVLNFHDARRQREEEEQERLAEIAHQARQQKEVEKMRVAELMADAAAWRDAQNVRAYADAVEAMLMARDPATGAVAMEAAAWLEWARYVVADRMDPLAVAGSAGVRSRT